METLKKTIRCLDSITDKILFFIFLFLFLIGLYAMYDSFLVYQAANDTSILKYKPGYEGIAPDKPIKGNMVGWLTIDDTKIDYPIMQGEDNNEYLNKDPFGDYSLSGSIFLDSRNNSDFTDDYSLIYGHHMENHKMFGDLDLYKNQTFFNENRTGTLYLPDRSLKLEILACFLLPADDENIFEPQRWNGQEKGLLDFAEKNAVYIHKDLAEKITDKEMQTQFLAMSTCSSEFTDARTVILAVISDEG